MELFKVKARKSVITCIDGWSDWQDVYINPYIVEGVTFNDDGTVDIDIPPSGIYPRTYRIAKADFDTIFTITDIEDAKKIKQKEDFKANATKILLRKFDRPDEDGFEFGPTTIRTYNALMRRGIDNIAKIYAVQLYWKHKVKRLRNVGISSINEINGLLKTYGLPSLEEISRKNNHNEDVETICKILDREIPQYISYLQVNYATNFISLNQADQIND